MSTMNKRRLAAMAADELWDLHQSVKAALASKLESQKAELDARLRRLRGNAAPIQVVDSPRQRSTTAPKFRNPAQPDQTWSGRGKRPRWVTELLNTGVNIRDFQVSEASAR